MAHDDPAYDAEARHTAVAASAWFVYYREESGYPDAVIQVFRDLPPNRDEYEDGMARSLRRTFPTAALDEPGFDWITELVDHVKRLTDDEFGRLLAEGRLVPLSPSEAKSVS